MSHVYLFGAKSMTAESNTITINGQGKGSAISLSEITNGSAENMYVDAHYHIEQNTITIRDANYGIFARTVFNPTILYNTINQKSLSNYVPPTLGSTGIGIEGCEKALLSQNTIRSYYKTDTIGTYGIYISGSKSYNISCNEVDSQNIGIFFGGDCLTPDIRNNFKGNRMQSNFLGLHLNKTAKIGLQDHMGNKWFNYIGPFGAVNLDSLSILSSEFIVNNNPIEFPSIDSSNNSGWFTPISGSIFICDYTTPIAFDSSDNSYAKAVAKDSVSTTEFIPENKSIAKQNLYEELNKDSVLLNSDSVLVNFYNNNNGNTIGQLIEVKQKIEASKYINSDTTISINEIDSLISIRNDSISVIDSLANLYPSVNYDSVRYALISAIENLQQDKADLILQSNSNSIGNLSDASSINSSINPIELPESNLKFINDISIKYELGGKDSISSYYESILNIASQCPFAGGNAVYIARNFVALFNDSIVYNDNITCNQENRFGQSHLNTETKISSLPIIILSPNPTDYEFKVSLSNSTLGICRVQVTNIYGALVLSDEFNCKDQMRKISVESLSPGVYTVRVIIPNISEVVDKLIIVR